MAKNSKIPIYTVPMPDKGVIFRDVNKNGTLYAFYAVKCYRKNGKPTCDRKCIGRKDPNTGNLIPNDTYFEYFDTVEPDKIVQTENPYIIDYGHFLLIDKCVNDCNLKSILELSFDETYKEILSLAIYMLMEGSTMNGCDIWFEKSKTYLTQILSSQRISEIFANLTFDKKIDFFKSWRESCKDEKVLLYDTTSFSSYTRNMNIFEYGYNRDNDDLPQINMALFFGETTHLPIFYNTYEGSITDKADLCNAMKYTDLLDITNVRYIMDRGFYSKQNIAYFFDNQKKFLMAVENRIKIIDELITKNSTKIINQENRIDDYDVYGIEGEYVNPKDDSQKLKLYLYYSYERKEVESKEQLKKIATLEKNLLELDEYTEENLKPYRKYFKIEIKDNKLIYQRNYEEINKENQKAGFFAFISNDETITIDKALEIYKTRGTIEQSFDGLKNTIDIKKLRTHKKETTEGKIFIAFISLIIKSFIEEKLQKYKKEYNSKDANVRKNMTNLSSYSSKLLLKELTKVQLTNLFGEESLLKILTKKQKDIYKIYDVDVSKIKRS